MPTDDRKKNLVCVFQVEVAEESDVEELQKEGKKREKMNKRTRQRKK